MSSTKRICHVSMLICAGMIFCISGCMNPYYGYGGYGYGPQYGTQPGYSPSPYTNTAPGSLYIPPSNSAPYDPGSTSTYDEDPDDDFNATGDFYGNEGGVPDPRGRKLNQFEGDLGNSTFVEPEDTGVTTVAGTASSATIDRLGAVDEYGFDTTEYRWLRGVLDYDNRTNSWQLKYSTTGRDRYRGILTLDIGGRTGLSRGINVDVAGYLDEAVTDSNGKPVYRVTSMGPIE